MLNNQFSSSQINETLLNAMKTIAQKEVKDLEFDVTEKCTIIRKDKDKNKEDCYVIYCNGVEWEAYETNGVEYYKNDIVLVNIPKNKWTEKKYIVGLADTQTTTHFFPASNFVPMLKLEKKQITFKDKDTSLDSFLPVGNNSIIQAFNYSNSLYLKCEFQYSGDLLDYDYGLKIVIGYKKLSENSDYVFSSDLFTGNPNVPYFFTQDILFENLVDDNFNANEVKYIKIFPYCSDDTKWEKMISEVKMQNLEVSIGHLLNSNTGIKIVTDIPSLTYNIDEDEEIKENVSAKLGLIWYNTDDEGNYIGFNNGTEIAMQNQQIDFSSISTDEYKYVAEKKLFDEIYSLYETGLCPYDKEGLNIVNDVLVAEKQFQVLLTKILAINDDINVFIDEYTDAFNLAFNFLNPKDYIKQSEDFWVATDDIELSKLLDYQTTVKKVFNALLEEFNSIIEANTQFKMELEEGYVHWREFFGKMLLNVRHMQDLNFIKPEEDEEKNEIELNIDPLKIQEPYYLAIVSNGNPINFQDIITDASKQLTNFKNNLSNKIDDLIKQLITPFQNYYNKCLEYYCEKIGAPVVYGNKETYTDILLKFDESFNKYFAALFWNQSTDYSSIAPIVKKYRDEVFPETLQEAITFIRDDIVEYKNTKGVELQNCLFWINNKFINSIDYEATEPYYNTYFMKYKLFIEDVKNNNWEIPENYMIIEENLLFNPEFGVEESDKNKFALYWYKEDLTNLEEEPLLKEECWTLIDDCLNTSISKCGFPKIWESPATQKEAPENNKIFYFQNCTPFNFSSMVPVDLDLDKKTTTFKVVLYYNHEFQGEAEITFNNSQYQSIGIENSLIDIEYAKDRYTLPLGHSSGNTLDLNIYCYDESDGRKLNPDVKWQTTSPYPKLIASYLMRKNYIPKVKMNYCAANKGKMDYKLQTGIDNINSVYFAVAQFQYQLGEDNFTNSYFPVAWCDASQLSLIGPKILYIKDENGDYEWDSWNGTNKKSPKSYVIQGGEYISDVEYSLVIYNRYGEDVTQILSNQDIEFINVYQEKEVRHGTPLRLKKIENSKSEQTKDGSEYTLEFDFSDIDDFLEEYQPTLKITGYVDGFPFTYLQSIFILHYNYNYEEDKFNLPEGTLEDAVQTKDDLLVFFDPREKDLFNYLLKNKNSFSRLVKDLEKPEEFINNDITERAKSALFAMLNSKKYASAFQFYFEKCRDEGNVLPLRDIVNTGADWESIDKDLQSGASLSKKINVVLQEPKVNGKSIKEHERSYQSLLYNLFCDLEDICLQYEIDYTNWQSYQPVSFTTLNSVAYYLDKIDWNQVLDNFKVEEKKE